MRNSERGVRNRKEPPCVVSYAIRVLIFPLNSLISSASWLACFSNSALRFSSRLARSAANSSSTPGLCLLNWQSLYSALSINRFSNSSTAMISSGNVSCNCRNVLNIARVLRPVDGGGQLCPSPPWDTLPMNRAFGVHRPATPFLSQRLVSSNHFATPSVTIFLSQFAAQGTSTQRKPTDSAWALGSSVLSL